MRELTGDRVAAVTSLVISMLFALATLTAHPGEGRIVTGSSAGDQDQSPPAAPPSLSLNPDNLDFGKQVARRTSAAKRITVRNTGGQSLYIDSVTVGGDNPNSFTLANDTCSGATVDANKACILDVVFTPTGTGDRNARLKFSDNAPDSPQRLRLRGTGINSNDVAPF